MHGTGRAYLPRELGALRETRRAERVALGDQAARRVDDVLAAVGVQALVNVFARLAHRAQPQRLVGDKLHPQRGGAEADSH